MTAVAPKTGRFTDDLAGHDHSYWAYVPEGYNPAVAYGMMVWIHPGGDTMEATMIKQWASVCERRGIILVGPKADQVGRWTPGSDQVAAFLATEHAGPRQTREG